MMAVRVASARDYSGQPWAQAGMTIGKVIGRYATGFPLANDREFQSGG
jgi:hypothetical protein